MVAAGLEHRVALHDESEEFVAKTFFVEVNRARGGIGLPFDHGVDVVVEKNFENFLRDKAGSELGNVWNEGEEEEK